MNDIILQVKINVKLIYIIIISNIIIWISMLIAGGSENSLVLLKFGAFQRDFVLAGEFWRMISSAFLHIGVLHLLINSYALFQIGSFVEDFFGPKKFIVVYVLTSISASLLSMLMTSSISAGASGSLFGLLGLILGNQLLKKKFSSELPIDTNQLLVIIGINLWLGFVVPGINNWAHIGGLAGGLLLSTIIDPVLSVDPSKIKNLSIKLLFVFSILILTISVVFWLLSIWGFNPLLLS